MLTDFQYSRLVNALEKYRPQLELSNVTMICTEARLRTKSNILTFNSATSRKIYDVFVRNENRPAHEATVQKWFNKESILESLP